MNDYSHERAVVCDALLSQATTALGTGSGLVPLGITVSLDGTFDFAMSAGFATNQEGFASLVKGFSQRAKAGEIRTAAICVAATAVMPGDSEPSEVVVIIIEHSSGTALRIHRPYTRTAAGDLQYGEPVAYEDPPTIFV